MFSTLSQPTRLQAFRLLVQAGQNGLAAGELSNALDVPHNTMSFHLKDLAQTGLVSVEKQGRSQIYSARYDATRALIGFLVEDCCSGQFATIRDDTKRNCSVVELADFCGHET